MKEDLCAKCRKDECAERELMEEYSITGDTIHCEAFVARN